MGCSPNKRKQSGFEHCVHSTNGTDGQRFQTHPAKTAVCINKYDTNTKNAEKIEQFCKRQDLPFIGRIPFDSNAVKAINNGQTMIITSFAAPDGFLICLEIV